MDQKIKYIVVNYVIIGDELYKKVIDGVLLKWLGESEAYIALVETHEGMWFSPSWWKDEVDVISTSLLIAKYFERLH